MFVLSFCFALTLLFSTTVFLPFGIGIFPLCCCMLKVLNFLFDFYRDSQLEFALGLKGDITLGIFSNAETFMTLSTHRHGVNVFYIKIFT